jgi:hypothetical protein
MSSEETKETPETPAPAPKEVRCIVLTGFGGSKMARCQKKPQAATQEGEVLIRVKAW